VVLKETVLKLSSVLIGYLVLSLVLPALALGMAMVLRSFREKERGIRSCRWCGTGVRSSGEVIFCGERCEHAFYEARAEALDHHDHTWSKAS
jgi:hypothetical protein